MFFLSSPLCEEPNKQRGDFPHTRENIILDIFNQLECTRNPLPPWRPQPYCVAFPSSSHQSNPRAFLKFVFLFKLILNTLLLLSSFYPCLPCTSQRNTRTSCFQPTLFTQLLKNSMSDVLIWTFRNYKSWNNTIILNAFNYWVPFWNSSMT